MSNVRGRYGKLANDKAGARIGYPTALVIACAIFAVAVSYLAEGDRFSESTIVVLIVSLLGVFFYFLGLVRKSQNEQLSLHAAHVRRLLMFNALRAEATRLIFQSRSERELFSSFCNLAVGQANLSLAWVGVPNEAGVIEFMAFAGPAIGYLEGLEISIDPTRPEGMGSVGRCWRAREPIFAVDYEENGILKPWKSRASKFGLKYNSVLPIYKSSSIYAVLALYVDSVAVFDLELQDLLVELADDLSFGVGWMATIDRVELLGQALEILGDGVCVTDQHGSVLFVNGAFTSITGYEMEEVLGKSLRILQGKHSDPETIERIRATLDAKEWGKFEILNYRKDGVPFWNSLAITPMVNSDGSLTHFIASMRNTTERKELELELATTNTFNQALLDGMTVGLSIIRYPERRVEYVNEMALQIFGASETSELEGHFGGEFFPDDDSRQLVADFSTSVLHGDKSVLKDLPYMRVDGTTGWMDMSGEYLDQGDGRPRIIWTHVDVTERHLDEVKILELSNMREALLSSAVVAIGMVRYPERVFVEVNQGFLDLLGYSSFEEVVGKVSRIVYPDDIEFGRMSDLADEVFRNHSGYLTDLRVLTKDSKLKYVDIHGRLIDGGEPEHPVVVWTIVDVTDRHRLTEELERQALFDALTDLPNRRLLEDNLRLAISRNKRRASLMAVGLIDLDDFKTVNDRFGHEFGDDLLRQLATRFRNLIRETDLLARLGGDEFVLVVEDLDKLEVNDQLDAILSHLHRAVESPIDLGEGRVVKVGMSMGVALYPDDAQDIEDLLRRADFAMYQIKARKSKGVDWWQLASSFGDQRDADNELDPFVAEERKVLALVSSQSEAAISRSIEAFYRSFFPLDTGGVNDGLVTHPESIPIVRWNEEKLRLLLSPDSTEADIVREANYLGTLHALIGISGRRVSNAYSAFRGEVSGLVDTLEVSSLSRDLALKVLDSRLQVMVRSELEAMQQVLESYDRYLARSIPTSIDDPQQQVFLELEELASLPGIIASSLHQIQTDGSFQVVLFRQNASLNDTQLQNELESFFNPPPGPISVAMSRAWRTGDIEHFDTLAFDDGATGAGAMREKLGVKGGICVPLAINFEIRSVLTISTSCSRQFYSGSAATLISVLKDRWERLAGLLP